MEFAVSTIEKPLAFFEDYFCANGIQRHFNEFKDQCIKAEIKNPGAIKVFIWDGDCVMHQTASNHSSDETGTLNVSSEFVLSTSFSEDVGKILKSEVGKSQKLLKECCNIYLLRHNDIISFLRFQKVLVDEILQDCSELLKEFHFCIGHLNSLNDYIQSLSEKVTVSSKLLKSKTESKIESNSVNKIQPSDDEIIQYSFFAANDIKKSFLRWLYGRFCENFIIEELDDDDEGEKRFIEIFGDPHPELLNYSIQFKVNNIEVAYIVEILQPFFKNLNPNSIAQSKCFLKKDSKEAFKRDDLYQANLKLKKGLNSKRLKINTDVKVFIGEITAYLSTTK